MRQIDSTERLSRQQKRIIQRTFSAVAVRHDLVARLTIERLRELSRTPASTCFGNTPEDRRRLMHLLALLVQRMDDRGALHDACVAQTRQMGCDPFEGGSTSLLAEAFIGALQSALAGRFEAKTEAAWREFFQMVERVLRGETAT
ncbi:MAG: globin [Chloroflexota bacterium]|nr:MAG: hypothetical protein DIU68_09390 [Chloroflexota bacterium]